MRQLFWDSNEIDPFTGQPYTWDTSNPNVTWDGVLEEGDVGWVPPPISPLVNQPKTKAKKVKHQAYYPTNVPEQILWLSNFFNKLFGHAITLGVGTVECAAAVANARWLIYVLGSWLPAVRTWQKACTDAVRDAQTGSSAGPIAMPVFVPPPLPSADVPNNLPAVVEVASGALHRIFSLVQIMQEAPTYTESLGTDLGIVGTEAGNPDLATVQPIIKVKRMGQHNLVEWSWDGLRGHVEMLQIQVDRGQGWIDLAYDSTPDYNDTAEHPATLTTWKYRSIWRANDVQVGLWSAESSIIVGG